jgi:hypothetical protein
MTAIDPDNERAAELDVLIGVLDEEGFTLNQVLDRIMDLWPFPVKDGKIDNNLEELDALVGYLRREGWTREFVLARVKETWKQMEEGDSE